MKRIFTKAILFLAGLAVIFVAASVYYELRVRQADDFFRQVAWFRNPDVEPVVLMIGDSRMAMNIDSTRLPPGFYNFSYPGETLRHLYLRAKFALETKPSIRYLIIGLEDVTFSAARAQLREVSQQMLFADLSDLTEVYPSSLHFLVRNAVLHYLPLINATQRRRTAEALVDDLRELLTGSRPEPPTVMICGGFEFARERQWADMDRRRRNAKAAQEVKELLGGSDNNARMHAVFAKILTLADRHGVKVIGVRNPLSQSYVSAAQGLHTVATQPSFGRNMVFAMLNYETLFAERPEFFFDADHLNNSGAARFTDRVVSDLQRLVSADQSAPEPCDVDGSGGMPSWPYNDVISSWLQDPACHNLRGDCEGPARPRIWAYRVVHAIVPSPFRRDRKRTVPGKRRGFPSVSHARGTR